MAVWSWPVESAPRPHGLRVCPRMGPGPGWPSRRMRPAPGLSAAGGTPTDPPPNRRPVRYRHGYAAPTSAPSGRRRAGHVSSRPSPTCPPPRASRRARRWSSTPRPARPASTPPRQPPPAPAPPLPCSGEEGVAAAEPAASGPQATTATRPIGGSGGASGRTRSTYRCGCSCRPPPTAPGMRQRGVCGVGVDVGLAHRGLPRRLPVRGPTGRGRAQPARPHPPTRWVTPHRTRPRHPPPATVPAAHPLCRWHAVPGRGQPAGRPGTAALRARRDGHDRSRAESRRRTRQIATCRSIAPATAPAASRVKMAAMPTITPR